MQSQTLSRTWDDCNLHVVYSEQSQDLGKVNGFKTLQT